MYALRYLCCLHFDLNVNNLSTCIKQIYILFHITFAMLPIVFFPIYYIHFLCLLLENWKKYRKAISQVSKSIFLFIYLI